MSRETKRSPVRSASRELFTVRNSDWTLKETSAGLFEISSADGSSKVGPFPAAKLVSMLAVIGELDRHIRQGR